MENSKIEWTHHTFNPWIGCTKVAPGCQNCYAEADMDTRRGRVQWGPHGTRSMTNDAYWRAPLKWNREAAAAGERHRVFCASLADVFEAFAGQVLDHDKKPLWIHRDTNGELRAGDDDGWMKVNGWTPLTLDDLRRHLFALIDATPHLDWLLLTKRPENIRKMWPCPLDTNGDGDCHVCSRGRPHFRANCWLGTSISEQASADKNIPALLACRELTPVLFVSYEPALGPVDLAVPWEGETTLPTIQVDWLIVGGESGPQARPFNPSWAKDTVNQCRAAGIACFVKQLGANVLDFAGTLRDKKGGDWNEWPADLRVRQFPDHVSR